VSIRGSNILNGYKKSKIFKSFMVNYFIMNFCIARKSLAVVRVLT